MLERRQITSLDGARKAQIVASDDLIFLSGMQPDSTDGDIKEQMRGALRNVDAALAEMGEDQASIFVIHIWIKDMRYFSAMNAVWNEWADAENPPARTCVSGELLRPDLLVELVVTACRTKGGRA
jgi:enamine deaminase RidA (YjgF/YER057c/UK114 family)